ncbi:hypothetical protein BVRB_9g205820 [Beta vulgaris subsp. vulgaris]|nr:SHUGOSHIN 2 isoform X2 [Beta vulgaris subsp. vulgaris]KMT02358.1 hypothetical protein BVRB_9g205820 [Beta vulgaris subsp. vulgaris]
MIKRTTLGSRMRKRLSDITNLQSQHKSPFKNQENVLPVVDDSSNKSSMEQLLKENALMMKLIEEKDKIIESNGLELQTLRVTLQKTQLQNWQFAQSNSQMLAELNMAKDRLKNLQHEFVSKDALFKAMTLELKGMSKMHCETKNLKEGETKTIEAAVEQPLEDINNDEKKVSKTKRGRPARSQSMGPTTSRPAVSKEIVENKRRCLRRQSMRLKHPENQDDLFEIDVANSPEKQTMNPEHRKSDSDVVDYETCLSDSSKGAGAQRLSIGRPQRRAAEKVQSYKDPPLNTKMRRP